VRAPLPPPWQDRDGAGLHHQRSDAAAARDGIERGEIGRHRLTGQPQAERVAQQSGDRET
jgi:hypothetical protein